MAFQSSSVRRSQLTEFSSWKSGTWFFYFMIHYFVFGIFCKLVQYLSSSTKKHIGDRQLQMEMDAAGICNSCILNDALMTREIRNHKKPLELQYHWVKGDASVVTLYQVVHKNPETAFIILCHLILHCIVLKGNIWKVIFQRSNFWHSKYIFDVYYQKYFILCLGILTFVNYLCESKETMKNFWVNFRIPVLPWAAPHCQKWHAVCTKQFWECKPTIWCL